MAIKAIIRLSLLLICVIPMASNALNAEQVYQRVSESIHLIAGVKVTVPANASLDYSGHSWECNHGYRQSYDKCVKVTVPANASLDYSGHSWKCNKGFKRSLDRCIAMTAEERLHQEQIERAILTKLLLIRRNKGVGSEDCEEEYKTGAKVCVEVTNINLNCDKNFSGKYYDDCDVTIYYELETDYKGNASINAEVECKATITYKKKDSYITDTDSAEKDETHSLSKGESTSESMTVNISFYSYNNVMKAQIESVKCEIENLTLN